MPRCCTASCSTWWAMPCVTPTVAVWWWPADLINAGAQVQIQVWDSGIGIAPEHQQDVFKEFYQVGNPARDRNKGLGLGLSIVQRTAGLLDHPLALVSRLGWEPALR